jgi:hypothetical protein
MKAIIHKLKAMPETLALLSCAFLVVGPLLILVAIIPAENTYEGEDALTYSELWRSWIGPGIVAFGIVLVVFAVGVFKHKPWVRCIWPIFFLAMILHAFIARPDEMHYQLIASIWWLFASSWYFFYKKKVVDYFSQPVQ